MKTGRVIKSVDKTVSSEELSLINQYTRRELCADEVYVFSVVLCDNDIDRDFERFTVESLFELEKLFVGKTGIFDHNPSAFNQTARVFSCKVEHIEGRKTKTGDDYFRLVARAYIPKSEKTSELILSIDSGILKEVSVGCAVKSTLCSICSNELNSLSCHHKKGQEYDGHLCYGELKGVLDAYEFSFVAIPAQQNAGVLKAFMNEKKENENMEQILKSLSEEREVKLSKSEAKKLSSYISELETEREIALSYKENLKADVLKHMCISQKGVSVDTLKGIVEKLSLSELDSLSKAFSSQSEEAVPQLSKSTNKNTSEKNTNNQFTI